MRMRQLRLLELLLERLLLPPALAGSPSRCSTALTEEEKSCNLAWQPTKRWRSIRAL